MDRPKRDRIADDLKGLIKGDLLTDDLSRTLYSTDASVFQVQPVGVVVPRDEDDVRTVVRYAAEHSVALIPRGAGTGLAGEALGTGLIVDLSQNFRTISDITADTVRVQPGVVLRDLNARLAEQGRRFAPDPASGDVCTIGGMLATNASGARAARHGTTRDHVEAVRVVFNSGEADWASRESLTSSVDNPGRKDQIVAAVSELLHRQADVIRSVRPRAHFDRCGYRLDVIGPDTLDLARLLVGSEGTLGLFTEAVLRTTPVPGGRALLLLGFTGLDVALLAIPRTSTARPSACELIDRRLLSLARNRGPDMAALVPAAAGAVLLVEFEADSDKEAADQAAELAASVQEGPGKPFFTTTAVGGDVDRLWQLRDLALPSLYGPRGGAQPLPFVEDVGLMPEMVGTYLYRVQEILQRHETTASFMVHAVTGQVHTRPFLDLRKSLDRSRIWMLAGEIHALALELGGTVTSQHGTGLARTPWVERQAGPLYPIFCEIKAIFDPQGLFNPGKIISPGPISSWPLRQLAEVVPGPPKGKGALGAHLTWQPDELRAEAHLCNGCGHCRTTAASGRMCPIFRATRAEPASPRAKANLMRHLLEAVGDDRAPASDAVREVADLCVNCKMCAPECPAHVNIPKLMLEAKAANAAEHGLHRTDWVLARTESFAAIGSAFAFAINPALRSRTARWLLEKVFGISRERHLPPFASRSFLRRAARRGWSRKPRAQRPRVAYFVDVFANYTDPEIGEAVVAVLHHNGVEVYVPPGQVGCGMAPLAYGDTETAREIAQRNLRVFAELAREGYAIVCSEPTAAVMLRQDYLDLLDDADARLVAEHTVELTAYLEDLHAMGRLRTDFQEMPFGVGHHVPCHVKALGRPAAGPGLLALVPGLRVHTIDVSCSGMAGTFGLKVQNHAVSLEAGRPMLEELARHRVVVGSTECGPCRMQMEQGSGKRVLHPVQYLAMAYGLMPMLAQRLS